MLNIENITTTELEELAEMGSTIITPNQKCRQTAYCKMNSLLTYEEVEGIVDYAINAYNNVEMLRHFYIDNPSDTVTFEFQYPMDDSVVYITVGDDGYVDMIRRDDVVRLDDNLYNKLSSSMVAYRNKIVEFYLNNQLAWQVDEERTFSIDEEDEFEIITSGDDDWERQAYELEFN